MDMVGQPPRDREGYPQVPANPVRQVVEAPVSTFSIDVDTAAYSNIRSYEPVVGSGLPLSSGCHLFLTVGVSCSLRGRHWVVGCSNLRV